MNSPTHSLIALALLSKRGKAKRNWAIFAGSLIPDLFIYICWIWLTFVKGESQGRIWDEIYFADQMQLTASTFNSVPLYCGIALIGYLTRRNRWGKALLFVGLAALIHIAFDFPVHNHDAYAHFWPVSDWRFISPFSYYEADHHGRLISVIEAVIAFSCIFILWRRFPRPSVRMLLGILAFLYVAMQMMMQLANLGAAT